MRNAAVPGAERVGKRVPESGKRVRASGKPSAIIAIGRPIQHTIKADPAASAGERKRVTP
jgi:hypothetical protein